MGKSLKSRSRGTSVVSGITGLGKNNNAGNVNLVTLGSSFQESLSLPSGDNFQLLEN